MAAVSFMSGDADRARSEAEAVLEQPGLPPTLYAAARRRHAMAVLTHVDDAAHGNGRRRPVALQELGRGEIDADDCHPTALVLAAASAWHHGCVDETLQLLWAAERHPRDAEYDVCPELALSAVLTALGQVQDAHACTLVAADELRLRGDSLWAAAPVVFAARVDLAAGRVDAAEASARTGLELSAELGTSLLAPLARSVLADAALRRGDLAQAAAWLDAWGADPGRQPFGAPHQRWSELRLRSAEGAELLADGTAETAFDTVANDRRLLLEEPGAAAWLVRVAHRAGDRRRTRSVVRMAEDLADANPRHPAIVAGANHARGIADQDLPYLESAAAMHRSPWARASAAEDAARLCASRGDRSSATSWLEQATVDYGCGGATYDAARIRAQQRDLGVRSRHWRAQHRPVFGWDSLTETEAAVTGLVAQGLSNQQVASQMFLSRHTIDFHLRHIYRKLGIGSRVALTRIALSHEAVRP